MRDGGQLTPRQEQVVRLLARGLTNRQIADELGISLDGAKFHVTELMNRYGVHSREEAVAAWRSGTRRWLGVHLASPLLWGGAAAAGALIFAGIVAWVAFANGWDSDFLSKSSGLTRRVDRPTSAQFTMHLQQGKPGETPVDSVATGEIDFKNGRMTFKGPDGAEQVFAGGFLYQRFSQTAKWKKNANSPDAVAPFTADYWNARMDTARDREDLGDEVINGELARHHRFVTDYAISPGATTEVRQQYRDTDIHFEVWLTRDDRLLQLEQRFTFENTGDPEIEGRSAYMKLELSNWNEPVEISSE